MVFVADQDWKGEETYKLTVCSPSWFAKHLARDEVRSGYHTIFMHEYNYRKLHTFVERAVQRAEAPTWRQLAEQLAWLGHWEFEGYSDS